MIDAAQARASEATANALMDRWFALWNAHDVDGVVACLAEDAVVWEPGSGEVCGRAAIRAWMEQWVGGFPDLRLTEHERWGTRDGSVLSTWFTFSGTPSGAAMSVQLEGMDRTEIVDGEVVRHQIFYDTAGIASQLAAATGA